MNTDQRIMNVEVKATKRDQRIYSFIIQYSVFDIRHSEKCKIEQLGIVTQPEGPARTGNCGCSSESDTFEPQLVSVGI